MHYFCKSIFNGGLFLFLLCFCFLASVWGCLNTAPGPWGLFLPSPLREPRCAMRAARWEGHTSLEQSSQHMAPHPCTALGSSVWGQRAEQYSEDAHVKHRCHGTRSAIARRERPCKVLRTSPGFIPCSWTRFVPLESICKSVWLCCLLWGWCYPRDFSLPFAFCVSHACWPSVELISYA